MLSLPFRLRYLLAWNHALSREVLAVYVRALRSFYRRRAGRARIRDAENGAVTAIQRFGSGLNLNVHYHTLALDGVFAREGDDWRFVPAPLPTPRELARLVAAIACRVERLLARHGLSLGEEEAGACDPLAEDAPALAALCAASVAGRSILGRATLHWSLLDNFEWAFGYRPTFGLVAVGARRSRGRRSRVRRGSARSRARTRCREVFRSGRISHQPHRLRLIRFRLARSFRRRRTDDA